MDYVKADGTIEKGVMPEGAFLRVQTRDEMVVVTEHRPLESGDFDQSIKMYGPFKTAEEQRTFMSNLMEGSIAPGPRLDSMLASLKAWRRYDEGE